MSEFVHLYGIRPVQQCLSYKNRICRTLYVKDKGDSPRLKRIVESALLRDIPVKRANAHRLGTMAGTKTHQGAVLVCSELNVLTPEEFLEAGAASPKKLLVALDRLEDPQNVGAIIRTAAFLGASGLIVLEKKAAPLSPAVSKASAGALESFPIIRVPNLSQCLAIFRREAYSVVGSSADASMDYRQVPVTDHMVLVLGNESQGLRRLTQSRCDYIIRISGSRTADSLNVGAAGAILIQHLTQHIFLRRPPDEKNRIM